MEFGDIVYSDRFKNTFPEAQTKEGRKKLASEGNRVICSFVNYKIPKAKKGYYFTFVFLGAVKADETMNDVVKARLKIIGVKMASSAKKKAKKK